MSKPEMEEVDVFYILTAYMIAELYRMHPADIVAEGYHIFQSSDLWDKEERIEAIEASADRTIQWLHRHGFVEGELKPNPCLTLSLRGLAVAQEVISREMLTRLTGYEEPRPSIALATSGGEPIEPTLDRREGARKIGQRLIGRFAGLEEAA